MDPDGGKAENFSYDFTPYYEQCPGKGAIMLKVDFRRESLFSMRPFQKDNPLPKTNYQYEKRQKELDKKKKKAEKMRIKEEKKAVKPDENPTPSQEK